MKRTLFDKIWDSHLIEEIPDGPSVIYIDRHYIHEVTSPQAFSGLEKRGIKVRRPELTFATCDHNVPTINQHLPISDPASAIPVKQLLQNADKYNISCFPLGDPANGIVHIIGPELGLTRIGMTVVCGDSHTSTHGAFGNIAFGIGTTEVEMVLATQTLMQYKPKQMKIEINGKLNPGVCAKDVILHVISKLGTSCGTGFFIEFSGTTIAALSMEGRMTLCNMSIEMGAKGALIAPDETTVNYLKGRKYSPSGQEWINAVDLWINLASDKDARFDAYYSFNAQEIYPMITFGTNPGTGIPVNESIPFAKDINDRSSFLKSLDYMGFREGERLIGRKIDYIFLGSCTNGRIEDFRLFASMVKGRQKSVNVTVWLVPGSKRVEKEIEEEGIREILSDAGFEIREPGCSACLAMNEDKVPSGKYCLSVSNRNFEGRQGPGARTLLCGPAVAAASAVTGVITDPVEFLNNKS
jgi:3-isopropylmalate/(R)-2-methylmalate dehydratase large subunit